MEHSELRSLLRAMIRVAALSFQRTRNLLPFAMTLNERGKTTQFVPSQRSRSNDEMTRSLQIGLELIAKQTTCKAVGLCSNFRLREGFSMAEAQVVVEHRDGSAYCVVIADLLDPRHWNAQRIQGRFFQRTISFSASTR